LIKKNLRLYDSSSRRKREKVWELKNMLEENINNYSGPYKKKEEKRKTQKITRENYQGKINKIKENFKILPNKLRWKSKRGKKLQ